MPARNRRCSTEPEALALAEQWSRESGGEVWAIKTEVRASHSNPHPFLVIEPDARPMRSFELLIAEFKAGVRVAPNTGDAP